MGRNTTFRHATHAVACLTASAHKINKSVNACLLVCRPWKAKAVAFDSFTPAFRIVLCGTRVDHCGAAPWVMWRCGALQTSQSSRDESQTSSFDTV